MGLEKSSITLLIKNAHNNRFPKMLPKRRTFGKQTFSETKERKNYK